jgi:signal transduction histidine kinase
MHSGDPSVEWLTRSDPLDVFAWLAATVMLIIAMALWLASYRVERRALRIFALRYVAASLGWWFAHPRQMQAGEGIPIGPALVGVALLGVTVWALDEFLGQSTARRRAGVAAGTAGGALAVGAYRLWQPNDPAAIYIAMIVTMALCAVMAWQASRREPNVGHAYVAAAFTSYPVVMVGAAVLLGWDARSNLSYLIALPSAIVGITILVVSLMRASLRTETELRRREAAEARLAEMNSSLEQRVAERTAELQVMIEGLESFARAVSHDLRGSLGGAAGLSRIAERALAEGDTARAQRMLQVMSPQLEHMASLVRELLTLSRLGDAALNRQKQPLEPLVRQALEQLALEPDCAVALRQAVIEVGELPSLAVDATLLRQVFVNLLANALRFATGGGRSPTVRIGSAAPQAGEAPAIFVEDNGPGFPPEAAGRLFEPFGRLHEGTLSQHGIGLSIVRRIVERHGGRVWADSRPGQGAVFWFALPVAA